MDKKLHIVSFDVPWPANYGGVIDVFHKLRTLHKNGIRIVLHCFEYGQRKRQSEIELYCEQVHYYKRLKGMQGVSLLRPYIVNSRRDTRLLKNLLQDHAPILFEGLHTCYYLNHPSLRDRKRYVRTHNIEHDYYMGLARVEQKWLKRLYYKVESALLKRYEIILKEADCLFAISEQDSDYFSNINTTRFVPAFHGNDQIYSKLGSGDYCLFHGNLAVAENEKAVMLLLEHVFPHLDFSVIIAGANPSKALKEVVESFDQVQLVANPTEDEMMILKRDAHIHVLYSTQNTGTKLKVIDSLCQGRFVIANDNILVDDILKKAAIEVNSWEAYIDVIQDLYLDVFTNKDLEQREQIMRSMFSNQRSVRDMLEVIYPI